MPSEKGNHVAQMRNALWPAAIRGWLRRGGHMIVQDTVHCSRSLCCMFVCCMRTWLVVFSACLSQLFLCCASAILMPTLSLFFCFLWLLCHGMQSCPMLRCFHDQSLRKPPHCATTRAFSRLPAMQTCKTWFMMAGLVVLHALMQQKSVDFG